MYIPSDINDIKPRATQVWNCSEIGLDRNGRWNKVICTYNLFQGEQMWNVECENWIASTILMHVTCIYPSLLEMLHATHHCESSQGVIQRSTPQYYTVLDIPSQTIWVYG